MKANNIIFWDDDTQYDFMAPDGNLYVPGAEALIDRISAIRTFALDNGFSIIASTDWHSLGNAEISDNPDFKETYPPHCLAHHPGAERVGDLGSIEIDTIETTPLDQNELQRLADKKPFHIVIRKEQLDVFSNPNTNRLFDTIHPDTVIVFGVALDVCVKITVERLLKRNSMKIIVLADAVKGLDADKETTVLEELRNQGVTIMQFENVKEMLHVDA